VIAQRMLDSPVGLGDSSEDASEVDEVTLDLPVGPGAGSDDASVLASSSWICQENLIQI
jgi:hypothetical protein